MSSIAGIGKTYREKLGLVLGSNPSIITPAYVSEVLSISSQEAGRLLSRWHKGGWISRIKRGVYVPTSISAKDNETVLEEPNLIADQLYGPGYLGGFTAIKHWDLSEQIIESVTFYTLNKVKDRQPVHGGITFNLKTISDYKVFATKNIWYGSNKVKVSDPSKTIIDILDDPKVVGGFRVVSDIFYEYMESVFFDLKTLIEYAKKTKNNTILKRLGFLLELKFGKNSEESLDIKPLISKSYTDIDASLDCTELLSEWRLRVSRSWKLEYDRKK